MFPFPSARPLRLVLLALILIFCPLARAQTSVAAGPYRVAVVTEPNPIPLGEATVQLRVTNAAGAPVNGAKVQVFTHMPAMNMGEKPQLARSVAGSPGLYSAPANFSMAGAWNIEVSVGGPAGNAKTVIPVSPGQSLGGLNWRPYAWGAAILLVLVVGFLALRSADNRVRARRALTPGTVGTLALLIAVFFGARYAVTHFRRPGAMTPVEAQAMDMTKMKPTGGAAPVEVYLAKSGDVVPSATYTGSVVPFNDETIYPRVTGRIVQMPVYAGDRVKPGQLLLKLDADELGAQTDEAEFAGQAAQSERQIAAADADKARAAARGAQSEIARAQGAQSEAAQDQNAAQASVDDAAAAIESARRGVTSAQSAIEAARADRASASAAIEDARAGQKDAGLAVENARSMLAVTQARLPQAQADLEAAQADAAYQRARAERSQKLFDGGAISRDTLQIDQTAAQSAAARVDAARSRISEVQAQISAAQAEVSRAGSGTQSAGARVKAAQAQARAAAAGVQAAIQKEAAQNAEVRRARAALQRAQAQSKAQGARVAQARAGVEAARAAAQGAGADIAAARGAADKARALRNQAGAQLSQAQIRRGYTEIRAANPGLVTQRLVAPGVLVSPGTPILKVAQINPIRVQANVAQSDLETIRPGMKITVNLDGQKPIQTRVSAVFPAADPRTRTGIVEALLPNADGVIKPGQYAVMKLQTAAARPDTLKIPSSAVTQQVVPSDNVIATQTAPVVWTVREDNGEKTAHLVTVKTGASDGQWTQILGGLKPGTPVIARGFQDLQDGDPITPVNWGAEGPLPAAQNRAPMGAMNMADAPAIQTAKVEVTGAGFEPKTLDLKAGVPAKITFTRRTEATCATDVLFPAYDINKKLPLNVPVEISFTPRKGDFKFACGMDMVKGQLRVQ